MSPSMMAVVAHAGRSPEDTFTVVEVTVPELRPHDLLVRVHGRSHLAPMPAAARRGRVLAAGVDGRSLVVDVKLPERGWGGGA